MLTEAIHEPDHIALRPLITEPLTQALISGLLAISDHFYSDELRRRAAACRPRHVKVAVDVMHERPEQPHTTASLARLAGVGIRNLQTGFRRHLNMPPMAYLRQVRLTRAHDDLHSGRATTVGRPAARVLTRPHHRAEAMT